MQSPTPASASAGCGFADLLIEQRGGPTTFERFQSIAIILGNLTWVLPGFQRADRCLVQQKLIDPVDLEGLWEELVECRGNLQPKLWRIEQIAICYKKLDAFADLPVEGVCAPGSKLDGDETYREYDAHSSRLLQRVHPSRERQPTRMEYLFRADAEVRALQNPDAGIKDCLSQATKVG